MEVPASRVLSNTFLLFSHYPRLSNRILIHPTASHRQQAVPVEEPPPHQTACQVQPLPKFRHKVARPATMGSPTSLPSEYCLHLELGLDTFSNVC